jgi:hypothetical protein
MAEDRYHKDRIGNRKLKPETLIASRIEKYSTMGRWQMNEVAENKRG